MYRVLFLCLLIFYFWYYYTTFTDRRVPKPTTPVVPKEYRVEFSKLTEDTFEFSVNDTVLWRHTLKDDKFKVGAFASVVPKDACEHVPSGRSIPASGRALYDYLKRDPDLQHRLAFRQDAPYMVRDLDVFYFECKDGRIDDVGICPSGEFFQAGRCVPFTACTGKPDFVTLPDPSSRAHYFTCRDGKEVRSFCGNDKFFVHNRCVSKNDAAYYCRFNEEGRPFFILDETTKLECVEGGEAVYVKCAPGTRFFDNNNDVCEPSVCMSEADGAKLPLPPRTTGPFSYSPGYVTCYAGKVNETVECPQVWDDELSKGDDLTHLPMVFDGKKCSVPTFCENVSSENPYVMVPRHEFTKRVRNWKFSEFYDKSFGYVCNEQQQRTFAYTAPGHLIDAQRYAQSDACGGGDRNLLLPVPENANRYYDCDQKMVRECENDEFFDGVACKRVPENAFTFEGVPFFNFQKALNFESWIASWNYETKKPPIQCRDPYVCLDVHNICSDPDCVKYAFLSMTPDLAILLPPDENGNKFKCTFHRADQTLRKEPVADYHYRFWDQKILREELKDSKTVCEPGQKIRTGNFVWDQTVYATCDETQPFVFCPSPATRSIERVGDVWACDNPNDNVVKFEQKEATTFSGNEIKRIWPSDPNLVNYYRLNNGVWKLLKREGFEIPKGKQMFTLQVRYPVFMELRYRVTHPPHVAFKYENEEKRATYSLPDSGFLVKLEHFTRKHLKFPKYEPETYVDSFEGRHLLL